MPVSEFSHLPEVTRLGSGGVPNPGVAGTSVLNHNLLPPLPMHKRLENQLETSRWLGWAARESRGQSRAGLGAQRIRDRR